ncbi:class I SAM-dependent methyltransferase [Cuniculiplasma sp. SKW4]|uniref:class I SAM-dependent methyltransferase n=1 Tax=Cuniculiplasma sp. SKW4 TaxID=3400171 RepID=UPI003FD1B700
MVLIRHLKVPKLEGEKAILSLKKGGMIETEYAITSDENFLYIPLCKIPEHGEIVELEREPRETRVLATGHAGGFDLIGSIAIIHERSGGRIESIKEFIRRVKPNIRTIYLDNGIQGEMRLRDLVLLYGEDDPVTLYRENGLVMKVDVKNTYFSPRLSTERYIVAKDVTEGEKIYDMFSGIGPFSLNIGKLVNCHIIACDINPVAFELFRENISMNRLKASIVPNLGNSYDLLEKMGKFNRIIMNNPVNKYGDFRSVVSHLEEGGRLNVYFVDTVEELETHMETISSLNMKLTSKRIVHGYSRNKFMFSLDYVREIP